MSVLPSDIMASAEKYIADKAEIEWRNGISRAYYAFFHYTLNKLNNIPEKPKNKGTHVHLTEYLGMLPVGAESIEAKTGRKISYRLLQAKSFRVMADYDINSELSAEEARGHFESIRYSYNQTLSELS